MSTTIVAYDDAAAKSACYGAYIEQGDSAEQVLNLRQGGISQQRDGGTHRHVSEQL